MNALIRIIKKKRVQNTLKLLSDSDLGISYIYKHRLALLPLVVVLKVLTSWGRSHSPQESAVFVSGLFMFQCHLNTLAHLWGLRDLILFLF